MYENNFVVEGQGEFLPSLKRDFYRKRIDLHSIISVSLKSEEECHFGLFIGDLL